MVFYRTRREKRNGKIGKVADIDALVSRSEDGGRSDGVIGWELVL